MALLERLQPILKVFSRPEPALNLDGDSERDVLKRLRARARSSRRIGSFVSLLMITSIVAGIGIFLFSRLIDDFSAGLTRSTEIEQLELELTGLKGITEVIAMIEATDKEHEAFTNPKSFMERVAASAFAPQTLEKVGDKILGRLAGLQLTAEEREHLKWAREQESFFTPEDKYYAATELAHRIDVRRDWNETRLHKMQEHNDAAAAQGESWIELVPSLSIRIGIVVMLLFLVRVLAPIHRYHTKVAGFYDACADAIALRTDSETSSLTDITSALLPDYTFDREPVTPTQQIAEPLAKLVVNRLEGKE